jgi:hypothetical protein
VNDVGRSGIRRRKRGVHHLPKVEGHVDTSPMTMEYSPYTVEGRIEGIGRIGRGLRDASPTQWRFVGRLFVAAIAVIVVVGVAFWIVGLVTG